MNHNIPPFSFDIDEKDIHALSIMGMAPSIKMDEKETIDDVQLAPYKVNDVVVKDNALDVTVEDVEGRVKNIEVLVLKGERGDPGAPTDEQVDSAVQDWLDDHPEATTTVEDGSIGPEKLTEELYSQVYEGLSFSSWSYDANGYLHLYDDNGLDVIDPVYIPAGGSGGGGSGNNAELTVQNTSGWLSKTISTESDCPISLNWTSIEDELPTGNGSMTIRVNNSVKAILNVSQGAVSFDVKEYLSIGANKVRITVADVYDNTVTITFTVSVVSLTIASSFNTNTVYQAGSQIQFTYTPNGAVEKTIYFIIDDTDVSTFVTPRSGAQLSQMLPAQSHGGHTLHVYFTAEIDGSVVRSNELWFGFVVVDSSSNVPVIASSFHDTNVVQYSTIVIPYKVYSPNNFNSDVDLYVNGNKVSSLTVDREWQSWSYRPDVVGPLELKIVSGSAQKVFSLTVEDSDIDVHAETEFLSLYLPAYGRSNSETTRDDWSYNDISAQLTGFNFVSDGWQLDENGSTVLRVAGDARVYIPLQPFAENFLNSGKTIELEFATRDILNYDSVILSCISNNRGFELTAQKAFLRSQLSYIETQYKEDEHVRISFVIEKSSENRLMLIYIDGIMSGVIQYPAEGDSFIQNNPVGISIGSNYCTTDIYCIRIYDTDLTRYQVLNNWIADTQDLNTMLARYRHNDVYDEYGQVTIEKLPTDLPYLVISCEQLPQSKGDKKTVAGYYVDPVNTDKSFSFNGATADVQGTSSQYYPRKNYKIKFEGGFHMTESGDDISKYAMTDDAIPVKTFTFKADVASSEGANNVELVRLYNNSCPYKTPPQELNPNVRQGIDGFPIVIFWDNGFDTVFIGKYNFNNDKGTEDVFGFKEGDESWEILNNNSKRVLWKVVDFVSEYVDSKTGEVKKAWLDDFEGRYPDGNKDSTRLQELTEWLVSTDRTAATNSAITSVTYGGVTYSTDSVDYRLAKFKAEFSNYAEVNAMIFYYLFTELFLMIDSRAKNAFPTGYFSSGGKWIILPYDMDTAIGINNEGSLVFGYSLEDTDHVGTSDVFNGQQSVLWNNVRDAYASEIATMYTDLRAANKWSYNVVEGMFDTHQEKWPEAIFNEDGWFKYIDPLTNEGKADYLAMAQGSKASQRKWWLYNRFRYMDSKYNAGDAKDDAIQLRGYRKISGITITPYADIYPTIKWGSVLTGERGARNQGTFLACPLDNINDTEIYIYSASQLSSIGDVSGLNVGFADFSNATRIQYIKIGDSDPNFVNDQLKTFNVGNNGLLSTVDLRNCTVLTAPVDLSGCTNIEHIYCDGTQITSCLVPNGGIVKTLHLPATISNLTIRNQTGITDFSMPSYANIQTLRIEYCGDCVPYMDILDGMADNTLVRLLGIEMSVEATTDVEDFYDILDRFKGVDENGNVLASAVVSGTIHVNDNIDGAWIKQMHDRYPDITITANRITAHLNYYQWDGETLLFTETILNGADGSAVLSTPTREQDAQYSYTFCGWSRSLDADVPDDDARAAVTMDRDIYAAYTRTLRSYTITWKNSDDSVILTEEVYYGTVPYHESPIYPGADPEDWEFNAWKPDIVPVVEDEIYTAVYGYIGWEETITDTWEQIAASIKDGSYSDKYNVGDTKILRCGKRGNVLMRLVRKNDGELVFNNNAEPNKPASLGWISENVLTTGSTFYDRAAHWEHHNVEPWFQQESNLWRSANSYATISSAAICEFEFICNTGTLTLTFYNYSNASSSYGSALIYIDDELIKTHNTRNNTYTYTQETSSGESVKLRVEFTNASGSRAYQYEQFRYSHSSGIAVNSIVLGDEVARGFNQNGNHIDPYEIPTLSDIKYFKWLNETVLLDIEEAARNTIVPTRIAFSRYNQYKDDHPNEEVNDYTKLRVPSRGNVRTTTNYFYQFINPNGGTAIKTDQSGTARPWALGTMFNETNLYYIDANGNDQYNGGYNTTLYPLLWFYQSTPLPSEDTMVQSIFAIARSVATQTSFLRYDLTNNESFSDVVKKAVAVFAVYDDGYTRLVPSSDVTVTNSSLLQGEENAITVSAYGFTCTCREKFIVVNDDPIDLTDSFQVRGALRGAVVSSGSTYINRTLNDDGSMTWTLKSNTGTTYRGWYHHANQSDVYLNELFHHHLRVVFNTLFNDSSLVTSFRLRFGWGAGSGGSISNYIQMYGNGSGEDQVRDFLVYEELDVINETHATQSGTTNKHNIYNVTMTGTTGGSVTYDIHVYDVSYVHLEPVTS